MVIIVLLKFVWIWIIFLGILCVFLCELICLFLWELIFGKSFVIFYYFKNEVWGLWIYLFCVKIDYLYIGFFREFLFRKIIFVFVYVLGWSKLLEFVFVDVLVDIFYKFYEWKFLFLYFLFFNFEYIYFLWRKKVLLNFEILNCIFIKNKRNVEVEKII